MVVRGAANNQHPEGEQRQGVHFPCHCSDKVHIFDCRAFQHWKKVFPKGVLMSSKTNKP